MEFNLIVPVKQGGAGQKGDEKINGRLWRVTGPLDNQDITELKFTCISYVWGTGVEPKGSFFDCQREISDQTRPALTAAMEAAEILHAKSGGEKIEAFWIDAICIPQLEVPARFNTLESMGFIYNAATIVLIVLAPTVFEVLHAASSKTNPEPLTLPQMQLLESDPWISRVWTYQELINGHPTYFTTSHPTEISVIPSEKFFNCVGYSLQKWRITTGSSHLTARSTFPNLNTLEDTIGDLLMTGMFEMPALSILSNMALRSFDPKYPKNRLLACLGALTTEVSWGPPSLTMGDLSEKFMRICEEKGDYSFIFTADRRMDVPEKRWRPNPDQPEGADPVHLVPLINWYCNTGETQRGHCDAKGLVLENLVLLRQAEKMYAMVKNEIDIFLYGDNDGRVGGVLPHQETNESHCVALLRFFVQIGFRGCDEAILCAEGLFFPQEDISMEYGVELFASLCLPYLFGYVGLARWREKSGMRYCAGIYVGIVRKEQSQSVRMI